MQHKHSVYDTDPHFKIDSRTRDIINQSQIKKVIMQGDHNSERFTFELPRRIDGHDMTLCNSVQIHYMNIDSNTRETNAGIYEVIDLQPSPEDEENVVIFSWFISANVTKFIGAVNFIVRFACVIDGMIEYAWHTNINKGMIISSSLINTNIVIPDYTDILEQWRSELIKSIPTAKVEENGEGVTVIMNDVNGETKAIIKHGKNGESGYSPSILLKQLSDGVEISVQNKGGMQTAKVQNGSGNIEVIETLKKDLNLQKQFRRDYINNLTNRIKDLESSSGYTKVNLTINQTFNGLIPNTATKIVFTNIVAPAGTTLGDASLEKDMSVVYWVSDNIMYVSSQDVKKRIMAPINCVKLFTDKSNLVEIVFDNFDTSNVEKFKAMFNRCENLESLDLSGFKTSNALTMEGMFNYCTKLKYLNISSFDTSNVSSMLLMFNQCNSLEYIDVSSFDTSNVVDMGHMFDYCRSLKYIDVSNFDTSNVTSMDTMFQRCEALTSLDVSSFNTSKVTIMQYMFNGCTAVRYLNVSSFDTSKVTNMKSMFRECKKLEKLELDNFDMSNVTNTDVMFQDCYSLKKCPFPSNLKHIGNYMYDHLVGLEDEIITIPASVETIGDSHIFYDCGQNTKFKRFNVEKDSVTCKEVEGVLLSRDGKKLYSVPRALPVINNIYYLPEGITHMCFMAFSRVHTIHKLVLPNSYEIVRFVEDRSGDADPVAGNSLNCAIYIYTTIKEYEVKENNPRYLSYNGCIYSKDGSELISVPVKYKGDLHIKEGCTIIGQEAFWSQRKSSFTDLLSINIPASVTTIENKQLETLNSMPVNITINIDSANVRYEVVNNKLVEKVI